jgi:chromosomal replication initiation ATPase DnaA
LKCNPEQLRKSKRVSKADKLNRDMLIYLLWQLGQRTNQQIGDKFDLTYSAVSQRVSIFKKLLKKNQALHKKFNQIKSQVEI